jgi:hypothetical protein
MDRAVAAVAAGVPAGDGDARPVVVVTNRSTGRLLYRRTEHERWLTVLESDLPLYGGRLRDAGIRRIVLVTSDPDRSSAQLGALYRQVGEPYWASVSLPFGRTATLSEATIILEAR